MVTQNIANSAIKIYETIISRDDPIIALNKWSLLEANRITRV